MLIAIIGKMAVGKSTVIKNMKLTVPHIKFDLDKIAKQYSEHEDIKAFIESNRRIVDETTKEICWKNVFGESVKYRQLCELYEPHLIAEVQKIIDAHQFSDCVKIVEASALHAYPKLQKMFDAIIEIGTTTEQRQKNIESRADLVDEQYKIKIADALFVSCGDHFLNVGIGKQPEMLLRQLIQRLYKQNSGIIATTKAFFCGSFDPLTVGHYDAYERACELFDEVKFVKAQNPSKPEGDWGFPKYIRLVTTTYIPSIIRGESGVTTLIRGVRTEKDYVEAIEWFRSIEAIVGSSKVRLVLIPASREFENISSTFVRALSNLNDEDANKFIVPFHMA